MTAHQRIRPFNTKETYPEQNLDNDLSQGVVARGTMVFLRGQVVQEDHVVASFSGIVRKLSSRGGA